MKKNKRPFLYFLISITALLLVVFSTAATAFGIIAGSLSIDESMMFYAVDGENNNYEYKCFPITNHQVELTINNVTSNYDAVAIGWNAYKGSGNMPTSISVSDHVVRTYKNENNQDVTKTYAVAAVCKAGFRHTSFTGISLPDTIEEMREEAFAYCESLTTFRIPYQVIEIAPSTFLDCRDLATITYSKLDNNQVVNSIDNKTITKIGDHAFDSCYSLNNFICPDSAKYFGKSCFQNCHSLSSFDFPGDSGGMSIYKMSSGQDPEWQSINTIVKLGKIDPNGDSSASPVIPPVEGNLGNYYVKYHADTKSRTKKADEIYKMISQEVQGQEEPEKVWEQIEQEGMTITIDEGSPIDNNVEGNSGDFYIDKNGLTIMDFAFADCSSLAQCYFEENLLRGTISEHAFTGCNSTLAFSYGSENGDANGFRDFCDEDNIKWRRFEIRLNSTLGDIPINITTKRYNDANYEGLQYTIKPAGTEILLDSAFNKTNNNYNTELVLEISTYRFAVIEGFSYPTTDKTGYYENNRLIIPNRVKDASNPEGEPNPYHLDALKYTSEVKVIGAGAFKDKTNIKTVKFNSSLVQIQHEAFFHCSGLTSTIATVDIDYKVLDFDDATSLKEVSYCVFSQSNGKIADNGKDSKPEDYNGLSNIKNLKLPPNLQYIGDYAFVNFKGANDLTLPSNLLVIGEQAFRNFGSSLAGAGERHIILPNTINDHDAQLAKFYHPDRPQDVGLTYSPCGLGRHCFDTANIIATLEMAPADSSQLNDSNAICSIGTSAFARCQSLARFITSKNLGTIGASCFKTDNNIEYSLREVFLTTYRVDNLSFNYPWGINNQKDESKKKGDPIFVGGGTRLDFVVYVDNALPKKMADPEIEGGLNERGIQYKNELEESGSRSRVPIYTNVDWHSDGNIYYWKPGADGDAQFPDQPEKASDYAAGLISIVKHSNTGKYTVARYFGSAGQDTIDLSYIPNDNLYEDENNNGQYDVGTDTLTMAKGAISSNITSIGDEAFAYPKNTYNKGKYIVLPSSVETISERAFYRHSSNRVLKVSYRNASGKIYKAKEAAAFDNDSAFGTDSSKYCCLPHTVKYIGRNAFYNNNFTSVKITIPSTAAAGKDGFFIGNSAFFSYSSASDITDFNLTDNRTNADFVVSNGGLYYQYKDSNNDSHKILVYQSAGGYVDNNTTKFTVTLDSDTIAVGMHAFANTKYTGVELPSSVEVLYGGAFQRNNATGSLKTVTGGSGLRYIGACEEKPTGYNDQNGTKPWIYTSIWNDEMPFDITDWWNFKYKNHEHQASYFNGAFQDCTKLETINIKGMTSLKKIGRKAFSGCTSLENLSYTGNTADTYHYCEYSYTTGDNPTHTVSNPTEVSSGVLYFSNNNMRSISVGAFDNCSLINYVHLPDSQTDRNKKSTFYIGKNPDYHNLPDGVQVGNNGKEGTGNVFTNCGAKILVGSTAAQAISAVTATKAGKQLTPGNYYVANFADGNDIYYHIDYPIAYNDTWESDSGHNKYRDIVDYTTTGSQNYKYWIKIGDNYIFFDNAAEALDFCDNIGSIYQNPVSPATSHYVEVAATA